MTFSSCFFFFGLRICSNRTQSSQLPLPYLKVGYLTAPPVGKSIAPHSDWKRSQFVLNNEGLQQVILYQFFIVLSKEI